jgi:hypothetical protein
MTGWIIAGILGWFFLVEKGNTRKAQRDVSQTVASIRRALGPVFSGLFDSARANPTLAVVIIVMLGAAFNFLVLPLINPAPIVWHYGVNYDEDGCGNEVVVGISGTDPVTGETFTVEQLHAAGADVIIDSKTDLGKEITLLKPGASQECLITLPPLTSSESK